MEFESLSVPIWKMRMHILKENVLFFCSPNRGGDVSIFSLHFGVRQMEATASS